MVDNGAAFVADTTADAVDQNSRFMRQGDTRERNSYSHASLDGPEDAVSEMLQVGDGRVDNVGTDGEGNR